MLESNYNNKDPVAIALHNSDKLHLVLSNDLLARVKEIIDLLKGFKGLTDKFEKKNYASITHIMPTFKFIKKKY